MIRTGATTPPATARKPRASGDDPYAINNEFKDNSKPRASGDDPHLCAAVVLIPW